MREKRKFTALDKIHTIHAHDQTLLCPEAINYIFMFALTNRTA